MGVPRYSPALRSIDRLGLLAAITTTKGLTTHLIRLRFSWNERLVGLHCPSQIWHLGQNPPQNAILAYQLLLLNLSMVPTSFAASTSQLYYMMWQNVDFGDPNRIAISRHRTGNTCQYPRPPVEKYYIHIEANEANSSIGAKISENIHQKGVKISNYFVYPQWSFCTPNQCIRI